MRNGSAWPLWWVWWWALVLCMVFCSVLPIGAQETTVSEQNRLIESLRMRLQTISLLADNLESESENWKSLSRENEQRAQELLSALAALSKELENSQASSESLSRQVAELKALQAQSENKLQVVLETWKHSAELWKQAADAADLRLRKARARGVLWTALAALAGGVIGWAVK